MWNNSLQKEIKENLLNKVIEENKVNTFIKNYFWINENTILTIYEKLLNSIFSLNKENEEIVKEMLTLLKQKEGFLLDNIFSVFRPSDNDLKDVLFKSLNLIDNKLGDKWILVLSESTFSDNKINDFFENIKDLIEHYKKFVDSYFINNVKIPQEVDSDAQNQAERDILNVYLTSEKDVTEKNKQLILLNNKVKVEKRKLQILKRRFSNELNSKLKELFNSSLQITIDNELELLNLYVKNKLEKTIVPFIIKNKIDQAEIDEKVLLNKLQNKKIKNPEIGKKQIQILRKRKQNLQDIIKKLNSLDSKTNRYITLWIETLDSKIKSLTKSTIFKGPIFLQDFKENVSKELRRLLTEQIDFNVFENESPEITKYFLFDRVFTEKSNISYENIETSEVVNEEIIKKKINWVKEIETFIENMFKTHKKNFQTFWENFDKITLLQYYLYKYKKNKSVTLDFFHNLWEKFEGLNFEHYIIDNIPWNLTELIDIKLTKSLVSGWKEGYELQREKDKQKQLIYKVIVKSILKSYFLVLEKHILEKWLNEKELLFLLNKEEKKLIQTKFTNLVKSSKKEEYYSWVYQKFLNQKSYISKLNESFLNNFKDFKNFYTNYIYLIANKELFTPLYKEFNNINHKNYLYLPSQDISYINNLVSKMEELREKLLKVIKENKLDIDFLDLEVIQNLNEVLINLEDISKVNILYFINYILTTPSLQVDIQESFISVTIWEKVFVFFSNPSFEVLNNITIYFMNNEKEKEKIFVLIKWNFYYFLNQAFGSNINLSWIQHEFKKVLEYSYHNKDVSDISIFGSKTLNAWYIMIREWKSYNLCKFKAWNESSNMLLFKSIEKIIENIILLWGSIEDTKVVDSTITVWWVEYRTSILRDGDRIWITFRKNGHKSKLLLTPEELQKKYNIEYENIQLVDSEESIWLEQSYEAKDIEVFKRYALQDDWIFWIVWKTGSWKSVSVRNILNYIFAEKLKLWMYTKIISLEDPIEVKNLNFTQFNVKWSELLDFIKWLKRSDPDVLLIWETRSYEMLMDVLEFSQMMGVFSTLHASSIISTLFLLGQYALRVNVWMTDVVNQTKVVISQKLLKVKKWSVPLEVWVKDWSIELYSEEEKIKLVDTIFKGFFSSYLSPRKIDINDVERWLIHLETEEEEKRYKLWKCFRKDFIEKWSIIKQLDRKRAWGIKLYYEYWERNIFKDNLNLILSLSDKDTELIEVERMFAWKTALKEERAFIDMIKWGITMDEVLSLSWYLLPVIYDKLTFNKNLVDWVYYEEPQI